MNRFANIAASCLCLIISGTGFARNNNSDNSDYNYPQYHINDLALIYQGGSHRIDWNEEQFSPYVVHEFANGDKDWLFDGFLFLEIKDANGACFATGYTKQNAVKTDWEWLMNRIFEPGKALSALDSCISHQKAIIGNPPFGKHKIVLALPEVLPGQKNWGALDGDSLDFSMTEDVLAATKWYADRIAERFAAQNYENLELSGYYWLAEETDNCENVPVPMSEYIHSVLHKDFVWIPYWFSKQATDWKKYGFDIAYQQPNHFFHKDIPDSRLDDACVRASQHGMAMEMEFDEGVLYDRKNSSYDRLVAYIDHFEKNKVFELSPIAYYMGGTAVINMAASKNPKDHELLDRLARLIVVRRSLLNNK